MKKNIDNFVGHIAQPYICIVCMCIYMCVCVCVCVYIYICVYILGMHDIYRTDKLSTDMGENDVIFIAPINK